MTAGHERSASQTEGKLLGRLVRLQAFWISLATFVVGVGLLWIGATRKDSWGLWGDLPYEPLGGALISGAIAVLIFEIILREDSLRRTQVTVIESVKGIEEQVRGAVVRELAFGDDPLNELTNNAQLDRLIVRALTRRFQDSELAVDGYASTRRQLLEADERWQNMIVRGSVSPLKDHESWFPSELDATEYFTFHLAWKYTCVLRRPAFTFIGAADQDEYTRLIRAESADHIYRYPPSLDPRLMQVGVGVRVLEVRVNGARIDATRDEARGEYIATADFLKGLVGSLVEVSYTLATVTRRDAHVITFEVPRPTRNVQYAISFDPALTKTVRILDFFSSIAPPDVQIQPSPDEPRTVTVDIEGWVFPKSGFCAIWSLRDDQTVASQQGGQRPRTRKASVEISSES